MNHKQRSAQPLFSSATTTLIMASTVAALLSGCARNRTAPLLGPRQVIPAPYESPRVAPTAEPALPALPDNLQWLPAPDLPGSKVPGTARINLPQLPSIDLPPPVETEPLTYTVRKGDSLWKIARSYGVTVAELASINKLKAENKLLVGRELRIPPGGAIDQTPAAPPTSIVTPPAPPTAAAATTRSSGATTTATAAPAAREPLPGSGQHIIAPGDSLWVVSRRYGVSIDELRQLNNLKSDVLQVGQVLVLPGAPPRTATTAAAPPRSTAATTATAASSVKAPVKPTPTRSVAEADLALDQLEKELVTQHAPPAPTPPAPPAPATFPQTLEHKIEPNDTLKVISEMYNTSVEMILQANPQLRDGDNLKIGTNIIVPYQ